MSGAGLDTDPGRSLGLVRTIPPVSRDQSGTWLGQLWCQHLQRLNLPHLLERVNTGKVTLAVKLLTDLISSVR